MAHRTPGTVVELASYRDAHRDRLERARQTDRTFPWAGHGAGRGPSRRTLAHRARMLRHLATTGRG